MVGERQVSSEENTFAEGNKDSCFFYPITGPSPSGARQVLVRRRGARLGERGGIFDSGGALFVQVFGACRR